MQSLNLLKVALSQHMKTLLVRIHKALFQGIITRTAQETLLAAVLVI